MTDRRADDDRAAHLDRILVGGRERRTVVIVASDAAWPRRFERERDKLATAFGARALRIEHVGSTSVAGLGAKPIVDVLVAVRDVAEADDPGVRARLATAGYELRVVEDDHRMFRTPAHDVHVHV